MSILFRRKIRRILSAELDKLVTLPSIWFTVMGTCILQFVFAVAFTSSGLSGLQESASTQSILNIGLASMRYVQAGFIVLGILAACSEYTGGQIRTTFTVIPWRGLQLCMKFFALAIIAIPMALVITGSGVLYCYMMMRDPSVVIEMDAIFARLAGATGYLTLTALLSAAIGSLLKRTIPALVVLVSYYFIVSPLTSAYLPRIQHVFPDTAGSYMYMPPSADELHVLTAIQGTGISMLWTLVFVAAAIGFYRKRDA